MRLVGESSQNEGRLEILYQNTWGTIAETGDLQQSWNATNAHVACRQLGYTEATSVTLTSFDQAADGVGKPIHLIDVQCAGGEGMLAACGHSSWGQTDVVSHVFDIQIVCNAPLGKHSE